MTRYGLARLGISVLDSVLPEGVPRGSLIIITGAPGMGKTVYLLTAVSRFLREGEPVVYITVDDDPLFVIDEMASRGFKPEEVVGKLSIIDGFLAKTGAEGYELLPRGLVVGSIDVGNPLEALRRVEYVLRERVGERGIGLLAMDSFNGVLLEADVAASLQFFRGLKKLSRSTGVITLMTYHQGIPGLEQIDGVLAYLADGVIELGLDPALENLGVPIRRLRVRRMRSVPHSLQWIPYAITGRGIEEADVSSIVETIKRALESVKGRVT